MTPASLGFHVSLKPWNTSGNSLRHIQGTPTEASTARNSDGPRPLQTRPNQFFKMWLWVKNRYPTWNPGKWTHPLKPVISWWLNFDPYPCEKWLLGCLIQMTGFLRLVQATAYWTSAGDVNRQLLRDSCHEPSPTEACCFFPP